MKNILILLAIVMSSYNVNSQTKKEVILVGVDYLTKDFSFNNESSVKEAILNVDEEIEYIRFNFEGIIEKGSLYVTILDPNGKKESGFELSVGNERKVSGSISEHIDNPVFGEWKVKIVSEQAKGNGKAVISTSNYND